MQQNSRDEPGVTVYRRKQRRENKEEQETEIVLMKTGKGAADGVQIYNQYVFDNELEEMVAA